MERYIFVLMTLVTGLVVAMEGDRSVRPSDSVPLETSLKNLVDNFAFRDLYTAQSRGAVLNRFASLLTDIENKPFNGLMDDYAVSLLVSVMPLLKNRLEALREKELDDAQKKGTETTFIVSDVTQRIIENKFLTKIEIYRDQLPIANKESDPIGYRDDEIEKTLIQSGLPKLLFELQQAGAIKGIFSIYQPQDDLPLEELPEKDTPEGLYNILTMQIERVSSILDAIKVLKSYFFGDAKDKIVTAEMEKLIAEKMETAKNRADGRWIQEKTRRMRPQVEREIEEQIIQHIALGMIPQILELACRIPAVARIYSNEEIKNSHAELHTLMTKLAEKIQEFAIRYNGQNKEKVQHNEQAFAHLLHNMGLIEDSRWTQYQWKYH